MDYISNIFISIGFFSLLFAIYLKCVILPNRKNKRNKHYNANNNFFRNKPNHTDVSNEYIESLWDEMKKH